MNIETRILDLLRGRAPGPTTAKDIAVLLGEKAESVAATCSRLHKNGVLRAESIWIKTSRPARPSPTLFYYVWKI
jgi:DNA-binding Lrp family transcriptional regulator